MGAIKEMYCGAKMALEDLNRISSLCKSFVVIGETRDMIDAKVMSSAFQAVSTQLDNDIAQLRGYEFLLHLQDEN